MSGRLIANSETISLAYPKALQMACSFLKRRTIPFVPLTSILHLCQGDWNTNALREPYTKASVRCDQFAHLIIVCLRPAYPNHVCFFFKLAVFNYSVNL